MKLTAVNRDSSQKLDVLRDAGMLPAVIYGSKSDNVLLAVNHADFIKLYKSAGETTLVDLELPSGMLQVIIHDVQINARTHKALHVDFLAIDTKSVVTITVPVNFVGEAPAVKAGLGVLNTIIDEVEIEVMPADMPQSIEVDISGLENLHDAITIADLKLPKSAKALLEAETTVCNIVGFQAEEEEGSNEIDLDSIEVVGKEKKDDEEAE